MTDKGTTGTVDVVRAVVLIPVAGFLVTGTSAKIAAGTIVRRFVDEDVPVAFGAGSAPAAMLVGSTPVISAHVSPVTTPALAVTPIATTPN